MILNDRIERSEDDRKYIRTGIPGVEVLWDPDLEEFCIHVSGMGSQVVYRYAKDFYALDPYRTCDFPGHMSALKVALATNDYTLKWDTVTGVVHMSDLFVYEDSEDWWWTYSNNWFDDPELPDWMVENNEWQEQLSRNAGEYLERLNVSNPDVAVFIRERIDVAVRYVACVIALYQWYIDYAIGNGIPVQTHHTRIMEISKAEEGSVVENLFTRFVPFMRLPAVPVLEDFTYSTDILASHEVLEGAFGPMSEQPGFRGWYMMFADNTLACIVPENGMHWLIYGMGERSKFWIQDSLDKWLIIGNYGIDPQIDEMEDDSNGY